MYVSRPPLEAQSPSHPGPSTSPTHKKSLRSRRVPAFYSSNPSSYRFPLEPEAEEEAHESDHPSNSRRSPFHPPPTAPSPSSTITSFSDSFNKRSLARGTPSPTETIRPTLRLDLPPPTSTSSASFRPSLARSPSSVSLLSTSSSRIRGPLPSTPSTTSYGTRAGMGSLVSEGGGGVQASTRIEREEVSEDIQGDSKRTVEGGEGEESIPEYGIGRVNGEDPFDGREGGSGGEKGRLLEGLRTRGGRRGDEDDAGSSRSAEVGSRDHLERWRSEQTSLESRGGGGSSGSGRSRANESGNGVGGGGSGSTSLSASTRRNERFEETSLTGMSDAEIAQHHFRLAQQHLEAAQRLAMAASQAPPPSAPPLSFDHTHTRADRDLDFEDVFPPSSTSSMTEYPESAFDDSTDSPVSPHSHSRYQSTQSHPDHQIRHQQSREDLYSEFGQLNLEGTKPLFDGSGKRARSFSSSNSHPPLSSVSEKAPPLPARVETTSFESRSLPTNPSKFSSKSAPVHQQHYPPPRISSQSSLQPQAQPRRRPSTAAEQGTPRATRQTVRRPSTADQLTTSPRPSRPSDVHPGYDRTNPPEMVPSLYGGSLPQGVSDRIGSIPPSLSYSASSASSHSERYVDPRRPIQEYHEDPFELEDGGGGGYQDVDDLESVSDYHDVQSTFSHVTNATLPPYEYARRGSQMSASHSPPPPPVPSIPTAFRQHHAQHAPVEAYESNTLRSQPSFSSAMTLGSIGSTSSQYRDVGADDRDTNEFHGFRPRLGPAYSQPHPSAAVHRSRTISNNPHSSPFPITESAQWIPQRHNTTVSHASSRQPDSLYAPAPAPSQVQPHSYILGADGRPIPVYASLPPPPPPAQSHYQQSSYLNSPMSALSTPVIRQPLEVHAQPLQFDHSIHINPPQRRPNQAQPPPTTMLSIPTSQVQPRLSPSPTTATPTSLSTAQHAYHLPPPSTFTQPTFSTSSLSPPSSDRPPSTTPSSTSSEHSSTISSPAPSSIIPFLNRNRLASSSASIRKMVRSPHVRFKSPEPSIAETATTISMALGEGGVEGQKEKNERNQKAMKQSLGMLM